MVGTKFGMEVVAYMLKYFVRNWEILKNKKLRGLK
jgi:hypothetical protein